MDALRITRAALALTTLAAASGCASTYGNLASANGLGAAEYRPAVLVSPEKQAVYEQILQQCRQASFNRQVTAAQKGQEGTITGAVTGAAGGASSGYQNGSIFKSAGYDTSTTRSTLAGAGFGALTSLAGSFSGGTKHTSNETRSALLTCLRSQQAKVGYTVLE